ncbi:MAG: hypothetical protein CMJ36_02785 [Phycisphaerae bacterium]|nr:hypothetical protein [Phycisphaerae bacterium]
MQDRDRHHDSLDLPPARRRVREAPTIGLNLTSMIDVVFLLLVYFMVATDFKKAEEVYRLDLPERIEGVSVDPFQLDDEPLRIMVRTTGPGEDDYRIRIEGPWGDVAGFEGLFDFLESRRLDGMGGGLFAEDHPLVVIPAAETRWSDAVGAFNAAVRAGYLNITFEEISS